MSFLNQFHSVIDQTQIRISADQGSRFAKVIAGDYNPIHDPESKRFCVPGDLLFALSLHRLGLHSRMSFQFLDLVKGDAALKFPSELTPHMEVSNERGKPVLGINCGGEGTRDEQQIESFVRKYVAFSGQNFPHILMPLMKKSNVMVNPQRPLVIYESMSFEFDSLDLSALELSLQDTELDVDGKRGAATLRFELNNAGARVGTGSKRLLLSGLRDYEDEPMTRLYDEYLASKRAAEAAL